MIDQLILLLVIVELFVLLGIWVSLPLLPAIMIYRYFPDTQVAASGPLAGLTVKTGGAFAAYLIVLLLIFPLVHTIRDVVGSGMRPFWEIRGKVKLVDESGKLISGEDLLKRIEFEIVPDPLGHAGGTLTLKVPQHTWGEFPEIYVKIPGWGKEAIDLNREPWIAQWNSRNSFRKTIDIGDVKITKVPPQLVTDSQTPMDTGLPHK
jgi:hypothetical protein